MESQSVQVTCKDIQVAEVGQNSDIFQGWCSFHYSVASCHLLLGEA